MNQQSRLKRPKRRRWLKLLLRGLLVMVVLLVGVYATLPWWAPKDHLRRRLAAELSAQLHLPVHVGSLSLGWADGVRIRDVTVASPEGFSPAPMIRIDRISADLSPITYLLTGRLNRLDILGFHLAVESDGAGRWNVASLAGLSVETIAPRMTVRGSSATFQTPWQEDPLHLSVTDLDLQTVAGRPLGRINMSAVLAQEGQPAAVRFRLYEGDSPETVAVASLQFSNLLLDQLPLRQMLPNLALQTCSGQAEGWAELRIDTQGVISRCNANVSVRQLEVQPLEGPRLPVLDKAGLAVAAVVDPITGSVWVQRLEVRVPGAELTGDAEFSAELMEGRWEAIHTLNLSGRVYPTDLTVLLGGTATLPGDLKVDGPVLARVISRFDGTHLDLDVSARGDVALQPSGQMARPMSLVLKGQLDRRSWRFVAEGAELIWGGNEISGSGWVEDVRPVAGGDTWSTVLARLASAGGHGQWKIADWDAVNDLLAWWGSTTRVTARGPVTGRWFLDRTGPPRLHLRAVAGPQVRLRVADAFAQPDKTTLMVDLGGVVDAEGRAVRDVTADLTVGAGRLTLDRGVLRRGDETSAERPTLTYHGQLEVRQAESLVACLPVLERWGVEASGAMSGDVSLWFWPGQTEGELAVSMQPAAVTAGRLFAKAPGQRADLVLKFAGGHDPLPPHRCRLTAVGRVEGGEVSAQMVLDGEDSSTGQANVDIQVRDAERLVGKLPLLADALGEAHLGGQANVTASLWWQGPVVGGRVRCHADDLEYVSPTREKSAAEPLTLELAGRLSRSSRDAWKFVVDQARLAGRDHRLRLSGSGTIRGGRLTDGQEPALRWRRAELSLTELMGSVAGKDVMASGEVVLEDVHSRPASEGGGLAIGHVTSDGLELRVGDNHGWILADVRHLPAEPSGEFQVLAKQIDDKDLAEWIGAVRRIGRRQKPAEPAPTGEALRAEANRRIKVIRKGLAPVALHGRIGVGRLRTYDAEVDQTYLARNVAADVFVEDLRVSLALDAAVNGGIVSRTYQLDLAAEAPQLQVNSEIRELMADEGIRRQLTQHFPGNRVDGLFSRTDDLAIPLWQLVARTMDPSAPVWPVGHAKTVAIDGMLQGRAAPSFVTRIFPGLNLKRYHYNRMTGFAEYKEDGTVVNDMVFSGETYDIYIEGTTDAEHIGRYEIGLILLGSPQSAEWNHTYRQGRIPLLNFKARIEGGRMHDETVTYPYPTQSLFKIFLKNNIFYRLWLASKAR